MEIFQSYSNYGEDAILHGVMKRLSHITHQDMFSQATYIDIGCYDPIKGSNTFFLYSLGWRGTLVDANPLLQQEILNKRPNDNFYNYAITKNNKSIKFYLFDDNPQCNTTSKEFAEKISISHNILVSRMVRVLSKTIDDIFEEHILKLHDVPKIVSIDVEGVDYDVISSYSFKYRPLFFLIEDEILDVYNDSKITKVFKNNGYSPISSNFLTTLYMDTKSQYFKELHKIGPTEIPNNTETTNI